jgi:hypothetical protein
MDKIDQAKNEMQQLHEMVHGLADGIVKVRGGGSSYVHDDGYPSCMFHVTAFYCLISCIIDTYAQGLG